MNEGITDGGAGKVIAGMVGAIIVLIVSLLLKIAKRKRAEFKDRTGL